MGLFHHQRGTCPIWGVAGAIPTIQERRVKMNRIHCVLLTILLAFAGSAFAVDSNMVAATWLREGYFDITNLNDEWGNEIPYSTRDSVDGIYLFVEHGCIDSLDDSWDYLRFFIGKKLSGNRDDSIWVFTGAFDRDSINSELRKGNPLSLDKFTKLEFDSSREQYLVSSYRPSETEISTMINPIHTTFYILYKKKNLTALCGISDRTCHYQVGCFYNKEGSFIFDSIPDTYELTHLRGCVDCIEYRESFLPNYTIKKQNNFDFPLYKINGIPATKNSSNVVIQNKKQPKLQLKGNE